MSKVLAIYFTGTGNSKKILDLAVAEFANKGYEADIVDVTKDEVKDINDYDKLLVSYPIYAFNAPCPIIKYVKKLNASLKQIDCLVLKNSGEHLFWNNASSKRLMSILKKKNIIVKYDYHYLMPYSFVFRHTDYMVWRMYSVARQLVPKDVDLFLNGSEHFYKGFPLDRLFCLVFRIQIFGGKLNGKMYKVDKNKCVHCNVCINNCAAHNISIKDGKIVFGGKCLMCQRCAMYCPSQAIKVGMFNRWKVGKPYSFKEALEFEKEKKPHFCVKSYKKYFEESFKRIENE